ncbi:MAG: DUF1735 domain-containing protein [Mariniphaga sp.]
MKNKIILFVSFVTGIFLLSACLKDKVGDYWTDGVAGKMYATVVNYTLQQKALQPVAGDVPISFMVNIATDALPAEDITLTLAVDAAAVTQYNADHATSFKTFPTASVITTSIIIPKGTRNATAQAKVWGAETLNACDKYMTAFSIVSAKTASGKDVTIAGNMKSYLVSLPISNPYAADYTMGVGYRIRPGNATEMVSAGTVETFSTVDCKTVKKNGFGNYTAFDIMIEVTTNTVVVGGTTCYKVIATPVDSNGAAVGGMWPTWTGDATLKPADLTINYYNPVTKVFILNCYYTSSAGDRIMYEVLTRK